MLRTIEIIDEPQPIIAPPNVFYSTNPKQALAADGRYVLKGPDMHVVFAEAVSYELATLVGLPVPDCGICFDRDNGIPWFASKMMQARFAVDELARANLLANPDILALTVAYDIWIANVDRNMGNFVGLPDKSFRPSKMRIVPIDFEQAEAIRGTLDRFSVTAIAPNRLWPKESLGVLCRGISKPRALCEAILGVGDPVISGILDEVVAAMNFPTISWRSACESLLRGRRDRIRELVDEVWQ